MSDGEKDRFGDKLRDAEKAREDQFFADRDRELLLKLKSPMGAQETQPVRELAKNDTREIVKPTAHESRGWLSRILGRAS